MMVTRLTQYFSSLVVLVVMALVYQSTFTPMITPPEVESVPLKQSALLRADDSLQDLFAAGSWQLGSCKQLQTSQGMLLFQKWEQTADDHWKLWPITVVIGRGLGADKSEDPIIIEAAEGAELKFTESLDVLSGGAPPIEWGRMIGEVRIFAPATNPPTRRSICGPQTSVSTAERSGPPKPSECSLATRSWSAAT